MLLVNDHINQWSVDLLLKNEHLTIFRVSRPTCPLFVESFGHLGFFKLTQI